MGYLALTLVTIGCALVVLLYLIWLWRRPIDRRLKLSHLGPLITFGGVMAVVLVWTFLYPTGISAKYLIGELSGVVSIFLMTATMLLAVRWARLEQWFGGLDRMYLWHRWCAFVSIVLLIPHIFLTRDDDAVLTAAGIAQYNRVGDLLGTVSTLALGGLVVLSIPLASAVLRLRYYRWLVAHRFIGLFLVLGIVHGVLVDEIIAGAIPLFCIYIAMSSVGVAAYVYAEVGLRRPSALSPYRVKSVDRLAPDVLDLRLAPDGIVKPPRPGQFIFLRLGGRRMHEHPFSIAGVERDGTVRLAIRALGPETQYMEADASVGQPATLSKAYGHFDYTLGGADQIWIAGGIGISPFLGWLDSMPADWADHVRLY
jgi:predicted ferric reductase